MPKCVKGNGKETESFMEASAEHERCLVQARWNVLPARILAYFYLQNTYLRWYKVLTPDVPLADTEEVRL